MEPNSRYVIILLKNYVIGDEIRLKKKGYYLIIILFIIISGCSSEKNFKLGEENSAKNGENIKYIAFAQKSMNSYFHMILNASIQYYTNTRHWEFEGAIADYDQRRQNQQIINFIEKKPDMIVVAPVDKEKINSAIMTVNKAQIPVALVDTESGAGKMALMVKFDNYLAGKMAAQEIVRFLVEKNGSAKGVIAHAYGMKNSSAWMERKKAFEDEISKYSNIVRISGSMGGDPKIAREWLKNILAQGIEIDAVHCSSDHPARGLVEALEQNGMWKKVGEKGHVIFVTIDGDPFAMKQIREGYYDASIVQDAVSYGKVLTDLLENYIFQGKEVPVGIYKSQDTYWEEFKVIEKNKEKRAVIPPYVLNYNNVDDSRHWGAIAERKWGYEYK